MPSTPIRGAGGSTSKLHFQPYTPAGPPNPIQPSRTFELPVGNGGTANAAVALTATSTLTAGISANPGDFRGANSGGVAVSSTSVVVDFSTIPGLAAGDTVRVLVGWNFNGTTVNTPSGWTIGPNPAGSSGNQMAVFTKVIDATDISTGSVTVTFSASARIAWSVMAWAGTVFFGTAVTAVGSTTPSAGSNVTTLVANSSVVTMWCVTTTGTVGNTLSFANGTTDANGKTTIASGTQTAVALGRVTTTTPGSYSAGTVTGGGASAATNQCIAFEVSATAPASAATIYTMVGGTRSDKALVLAKTSGATSVQIGYSTDPTMATGVSYTTAAAPDSNHENRVDITGLAAGTKFYYQVFDTPSGGSRGSISTTRSFRTRPSPAGMGSVKVALGSCVLTATAQSTAALPDMVAWDPDYCVHLGDAYYNGNSANTLASQHRTLWESQISAVPDWKSALEGVAFEYINSDHELNPDDTDTNNTLASSFNDFYKQTIPARLVDTASPPVGKYRSWVDSGIRFIMLDVRNTDRSPGAGTDSSSKTMLGATQKAWLKNELIDSDGTKTHLKVIISDVPWSNVASLSNGIDKWWSYATERQEIADYITSNAINVDFLHGDSHRIAVDQTHNAWGGFPVICGSPFSQNAGGNETAGFWDAFYAPGTGSTPVSNYMRLTYSYPGDGTVRRVASGWDAINNVERVSQTYNWTITPVAGAVALTATSTLSATPVREAVVAAGLTASSTLTTAATQTSFAAVSLTGTSTLTAAATQTAGVVTQNAAIALSSSSTLTSAAVRAPQAAIALSSTSSLTSAAVRAPQAAISLTGTSTLTSAGFETNQAAIALSGTSTLTSAAIRQTLATAALSASSTLVTAGVRQTFAAIALSATSVLTVGSLGISYSAGVLNNAPLAYYRLGESSGTTMADSSPNGHNGLYFATKASPPASLLAGDTDLATAQAAYSPGAAWMETNNAVGVTVVCLIKPGSAQSNRGIVTRWDASTCWILWMDVSGHIAWRPHSTGGTVDLSWSTAPTVSSTYHVAATYVSGQARLYINGTQVDSSTALSGDLISGGSIQSIEIGSYQNNSWPYDGVIDEVSIYAGELTPTQISDDYARSLAGSVGQPVTRTTFAAVPLTAVSTLTSAGVPERQAAASLSTVSTLTSDGVRSAQATASLSASSTLAASGTKTSFATASLTAASILTSAVVRTQPATISLSASSTLVSAAFRAQFAAIALSSTSTLVAGVGGQQVGAVALVSASTLSSAAVRTRLAAISLVGTGTLSSAITRASQVAAALSGTSTTTVAGFMAQMAAVPLDSTSTLTTTVIRLPQAAIVLSVTSTLTTLGVRTSEGGIGLTSVSTLTATATIIPATGIQALLVSVSVTTVGGTSLNRAAVALLAHATLTPSVIKPPDWWRIFLIASESRIQVISFESRSYSIAPQERVVYLYTEERIMVIPPESRSYSISPESRLDLVPIGAS